MANCSQQALRADDFVWSGTTGVDWQVSTLWTNLDEPGIDDGMIPDDNTDTATLDFPGGGLTVLSADRTIGALTVENDSDFATGLGSSNFALIVQNNGGLSGLTRIAGAGSVIMVRDSPFERDFDTDDLKIDAGGVLLLQQGTAQIDDFFDLNSGGVLIGAGTLQINGITNFVNDGSITALGGTLTIERSEFSTAMFDLDGAGSGSSALRADVNSTLIVDIPLTSEGGDDFEGTLSVAPNGELEINTPWELSGVGVGGSLDLNGGFGVATVSGSPFTLTGPAATINVHTGTGRLAADVAILDGMVHVEFGSTFQLDGAASVGAAATFTGSGTLAVMPSATLNLQDGANVAVAVANLGGEILLGSSPGEANVFSYMQEAGATLAIDIDGALQATQFDYLDVDGAAELDGALEVNLGFEPVHGEGFQVMTFKTRSGVFDSVVDSGLPDLLVVAPFYSDTDLTLRIELLADSNGDGLVGPEDYTLWANHFGNDEASYNHGDYNRDGRVGAEDFTLWANHFGEVVASAESVHAPLGKFARGELARGGPVADRPWGAVAHEFSLAEPVAPGPEQVAPEAARSLAEPAAAVPEPSALVVFLLGTLPLFARRSRGVARRRSSGGVHRAKVASRA